MTSNPLMRSAGAVAVLAPVRSDQEWCDDRNRNLTRDDIEWVVGSSGPYLRHKQAWSDAHTKRLKRDREAERQRWIEGHAQGQPR